MVRLTDTADGGFGRRRLRSSLVRYRRKALTVAIVSTVLLNASAVQAMDIIQFDLMTNQDQQTFMDFQSVAVQTVLKQEGRSDDATKVFHLFNDISRGSDLPLGEGELK